MDMRLASIEARLAGLERETALIRAAVQQQLYRNPREAAAATPPPAAATWQQHAPQATHVCPPGPYRFYPSHEQYPSGWGDEDHRPAAAASQPSQTQQTHGDQPQDPPLVIIMQDIQRDPRRITNQ
jgi:hypothetical protein